METREGIRPGKVSALEPILVYQMGKVGSCSVFDTLRDLGYPVTHLHHLSDAGLEHIRSMMAAGIPSEKVQSLLSKAEQTREEIMSLRNRRPRVITLVREPVARAVSCVFHHLYVRFPELENLEELTPEWQDRILQTILAWDGRFFLDPQKWLEVELNKQFRCNALSLSFNQEKGYSIYRLKKCDLLVLRLEDLSRCGEEAVSEFLGISEMPLQLCNFAQNKPYFPLYQKFLDKAVFPESFLSSEYSTRFARHYYSLEERLKLISRWGHGIDTSAEHWESWRRKERTRDFLKRPWDIWKLFSAAG